MEKYIHLIIGILAVITAVGLVFYGIYADRLYLCGEGVMYAIIALLLIHNYNEAKQKESDGI